MFPFQLGMTAVGIGMSIYGASKKAKAAKELAANSAEQEALRKEAAQLTHERNTRELIRKGYLTADESTSRMFAGAGLAAGSSAVGGTRGQEANQTAGNVNAEKFQFDLGMKMFDARAKEARIKQKQAEASTFGQIGSMLTGNAKGGGEIFGSLVGGLQNLFQPGQVESGSNLFGGFEQSEYSSEAPQ